MCAVLLIFFSNLLQIYPKFLPSSTVLTVMKYGKTKPYNQRYKCNECIKTCIVAMEVDPTKANSTLCVFPNGGNRIFPLSLYSLNKSDVVSS